jgi:hypothetical protein
MLDDLKTTYVLNGFLDLLKAVNINFNEGDTTNVLDGLLCQGNECTSNILK